MKILGNIIWLIFGGIIVALQYFISSIGLFITIIGIPFGLQTIKLGLLALWPFGSEIIHKESPHGCLSNPNEHHLVFHRRSMDIFSPIFSGGFSFVLQLSESPSDYSILNWPVWLSHHLDTM